MSEIQTLEEKKEAPETEVSGAPIKGLIGTKMGMTRVFVDETHMVPVTIISAESVIVSQVKTKENDGYNAIQVGYQEVVERKISKAEANHLTKKGLPLK